ERVPKQNQKRTETGTPTETGRHVLLRDISEREREREREGVRVSGSVTGRARTTGAKLAWNRLATRQVGRFFFPPTLSLSLSLGSASVLATRPPPLRRPCVGDTNPHYRGESSRQNEE